MTRYLFDETMADLSDARQRAAFKHLKPKMRKAGRVLVTRRYAPQAYTYQKRAGIANRVINLYDYFQETVSIAPHDLVLRQTPLIDHRVLKIVGMSPEQSKLYQAGRLVADVRIAPLTVQLIGTITWLNAMGEPTSRDIYDRRGFLSSTQYFNPDGSFGHQVFFNPQGQPKIELICMKVHGKVQVSGYKLLDYQGADYLFTSEQEAWQFFKDELKTGAVN